MGGDPQAHLAYGYDLGSGRDRWLIQGVAEDEDLERPWFNRSDDFGSSVEAALHRAHGFAETNWNAEGYFARQRAADVAIGVEVRSSGAEGFWNYLLVAADSHCSVEWAATMEVDPFGMANTPGALGWDKRLAAALRVLDLQPVQQAPRWIIYSTYA